jgi:adenine/guanine phosphoribosyltransferase-like PRPP-binding protein
VGALEVRQDEEQERLADEAEIIAVHRTAEYAAELAEQDRDAADFIASREVAGFEWAAALARELEAERRGRQ